MRCAKTHIATCLLALMMVTAIGGCSGYVPAQAEPDITEAQSRTVSFCLLSEGGDLNSTDSFSTRAAVKSYAKFLTLALFDEGGTKKYEVQQKSSDTGFGTVNKQIDFGTYTVVVVANNGDDFYVVNSPSSVTLPTGTAKVLDTFCYAGKIEISATSSADISIELKRAVSAIGVQLTDTSVPDNFDHFRFELTGGSTVLNPTTGYGEGEESQAADVNYNSTAKQHGIFTFPIKGNDEGVTFKASAIGKDGSTIVSYSFDHLTAAPKKMIVFKGEFFAKSGFAVSIPDSETTWTTSEQSLHQ